MSQSELFGRMLAPDDAGARCFGVVVGIVTNNTDPLNMHRIKVKFPWLSDRDESAWARIATMMAGNDRGSYFLPEIDDEVLVVFEHGNVDHPYIIGALWNGRDRPPETNDGNNDRRTIKSRSGHILRLDDSSGAGKIEIIDSTGGNTITISSADNSITIEAQGNIAITSASGKVTIKGVGIELSSQTDVKIAAQTTLDMSSSGPASLKGALVNIN